MIEMVEMGRPPAVESTSYHNALGMLRLLPLYAAFGLLRHFVSIDTLVRWAWKPPRRPRNPARERQVVAQTIRLGQLLGRRDRDCLQRSLVLYRRLSLDGARPLLHIGLVRQSHGISGHAWVVVEGHPIAEAEDQLIALTPVCVYGPDGRPLPDRRT